MATRHTLLAACVALVGCSAAAEGPVTVDPDEAGAMGAKADGIALPELHCEQPPDAGEPGSWRHALGSRVVTALGSPRHRGIDLVVGASAVRQIIRGEVSYGLTDKALEDETVELLACRAGSWRYLGSAITDDEGMFHLDLTGEDRLPIGIRPLYLSVVGDRTGIDFVALVAPEGTHLVFSDIDGTLTSSENAYPKSLITNAEVTAHEGAAEALHALRARRYYPVYVTARGRRFTAATRDWLVAHRFPRGALRLAPSLITVPGGATVAYKASTLEDVARTGLVPAVGVGNRASDAEAYARAAIPAAQILLKMTEYGDENRSFVERDAVIGFESYRDLLPYLQTLPVGP